MVVDMTERNDDQLTPIGSEGAELKRDITADKFDKKKEPFDPGASMLGTDNEAGAPPDPDGMAQARKAPKP